MENKRSLLLLFCVLGIVATSCDNILDQGKRPDDISYLVNVPEPVDFPVSCVSDFAALTNATCGHELEKACSYMPYTFLHLWRMSSVRLRHDPDWLNDGQKSSECKCVCNMRSCLTKHVRKWVAAGNITAACATSYSTNCAQANIEAADSCKRLGHDLKLKLRAYGAAGGPNYGVNFEPCDYSVCSV